MMFLEDEEFETIKQSTTTFFEENIESINESSIRSKHLCLTFNIVEVEFTRIGTNINHPPERKESLSSSPSSPSSVKSI